MEPSCARGSVLPARPREFFSEVTTATRGDAHPRFHWFDSRVVREPHASPICREALLYNIFNTCTEGHATGWEDEMQADGRTAARARASSSTSCWRSGRRGRWASWGCTRAR